MKTLSASLAILLLAAPYVMAQADDGLEGGAEEINLLGMQGELIRSRDITGGDVYTTNAAQDEGWEFDNVHDGIGADWNRIGEIEDLVLDRGGQIVGIVAEVGGFLDIGDKHVVIEVDDLNLVAVDDVSYAYVTRLNEEDLEAMQDVDEGFWD
ncbi:PRC-barrel domain-containing protein [Roseicyclus sp.]|uniref:PRC-barrel domain-containing protein n=1 Tax=Roseicyclus sp. TaxID=1914329 RepID=UPI003F9F8624